jgi:hypothetical protein
MKIYYGWNNGTPFISVSGVDFDGLRLKLGEFLGKSPGNVRDEKIWLGGRSAIKALEILGVGVPEMYENWVKKWKDKRTHHQITDQEILDEARQFKYRGDWAKSGKFYQLVHKRRPHLINACTAHMESACGPFPNGFQVYVYEFKDKTAYVGLTCHPVKRHKNHLEKGPVSKKIVEGIKFELKILRDGLTPGHAANAEAKFMREYAEVGWKLLNKDKAGSFGSLAVKYDFEKLVELAKGFRSRTDFAGANYGAYQFALTKNLVDQLAEKMAWPKHKDHWSYEELVVEAKKWPGRGAWAENGDGYNSAYKRGLLDKISKEVGWMKPWDIQKGRSKWTYEACLGRAKNFRTRTAWQYEVGDGSYIAARKKGWLKQIYSEISL